tara:strand:+ start:65 stop:781 length:717 start_codon:yes stop_codon:yes gene_type:complete
MFTKIFKMRKAIFILATFFTISLNAQNITWQNVNLNVPFENTESVFNLIDGFYSNIIIPEGLRVSLWSIEYKGSSEKATHILNFAGSKESIAKFESRKLTPEWDAYISRLNSLTNRDGFSLTAGVTLVRYNLDKWQETIAQSHQWKVKDPLNFMTAFANLMSAFIDSSGYVSIGQTTHGVENGETHYIYSTFPDLVSALDFGNAENQEQSEAILNWIEATKNEEYTRSITRVMLQSWE